MYKLFRSELLKSKRTLLRPVLFIGAVIFAILLMIIANLAPDTLCRSTFGRKGVGSKNIYFGILFTYGNCFTDCFRLHFSTI